jgi:hypothetical protein
LFGVIGTSQRARPAWVACVVWPMLLRWPETCLLITALRLDLFQLVCSDCCNVKPVLFLSRRIKRLEFS